jgi:hypothetical protein
MRAPPARVRRLNHASFAVGAVAVTALTVAPVAVAAA